MSIITIAWSMVAAIAATMSLTQLVLWVRDPSAKASLVACIMSLAAGFCALFEMGIAKATDPDQVQSLFYFMNIAVFMMLVPMVWFVRIYLESGRLWLLWLITALWTFALAVNFLYPGNLTFLHISELKRHLTMWDETWSLPIGDPNPFRWVADLASLLIIGFAADASFQAFRNGSRRKAIVVGGAITAFILVAGVHTPLVDAGLIKTPYMISWAFVAIAASLGFDLIDRAIGAAELDRTVRESEERWRTLIENVELGVLGLDQEGRITFLNPFMEDLLGYGRPPVQGRLITDLAPPELKHDLSARIARARIHGPAPQTEFPLLNVRGELHHLRWSIVALHDHDSEIIGFMAICEDVTSLRQSQEKLDASQRLIEQLDRAAFLTEIASGLAHELNQPLAAILSNAQAGLRLMKSDPVPEDEIRDILQDIANDDKRAGEVIHGLRAMLKKGRTEREVIDFKNLVLEVQNILSRDFLSNGITLLIEDGGDLPRVFAGKTEIQQVMMNLLVNAAKVMRSAGTENPRISISARIIDERLLVSVSDNGPGLDDVAMRRVFEPFYSTSEDGTGMGLPISRRIVEMHGGELECDGKPGHGATFRFTLPLAEKPAETMHV